MSSSDAGPTDPDRQTTAFEQDRVTYREVVAVLDQIDDRVDDDVFPNRSEAIREATRQLVDEYELKVADIDE